MTILRFTYLTLLLFASLFSSMYALGSTNEIHNKIVSCSKGKFGTIVGQNKHEIYFITVYSEDQPILSQIENVRFYKRKESVPAKLIVSKDYASIKFCLYKCNLPSNQSISLGYFSSLKGEFFETFIDNGVHDEIWAKSIEAITIAEFMEEEIALLKIDREDDITAGSPILNEHGAISAIFIEENTSYNNAKSMLRAFDFSAVVYKLFPKYCDYFDLIEFGQISTVCELLKPTVSKEVKPGSELRMRRWYSGLNSCVFGGVTSDSEYDSTYFSGRQIGISISYFLNTKGSLRATVKPRIGRRTWGSDRYIWKSSDGVVYIGYDMYQYFELPLMIEFGSSNSTDISFSFAIGYAPGKSLKHFEYNNFTHSLLHSADFQFRDKFVQNIPMDLWVEYSVIRLGLIVSKDIGKYPEKSASIGYNNISYSPLENAPRLWNIGFGAEINIGARWGMQKIRTK